MTETSSTDLFSAFIVETIRIWKKGMSGDVEVELEPTQQLEQPTTTKQQPNNSHGHLERVGVADLNILM
jgi:hypothetical protein